LDYGWYSSLDRDWDVLVLSSVSIG
jgi:hypothetical protein